MGHPQLLLDISPRQLPTLDNFVVGGNTELLARLSALAAPGVIDMIYLWGPPGSGRSHLLHGALAAARNRQRPAVFCAGAEPGAKPGNAVGDSQAPIPGSLVIVDDVDALGDAAQIALFRAFNAARRDGLALLLSGGAPPLRLARLREDLRTRIGSALVYEVQPLSDAEKSAALLRHGASRGMRIDSAIIDYLLRHGRRDLPSLLAVLDALDRASLQQQRPVTLPLLREILQTEHRD